MAEAMQGVMSLMPEMGGAQAAPQSYLTPEDEATLEQLRSSTTPYEFSTDMFDAAEQADPQTVAQLRAMLRGMQLPRKLLMLMQQMIELLLAAPEAYAESRQEFIKQGVPEELLPAEFDPSYLAAFSMALDQLAGPAVQGFAKGGLVKNPIAAGIASLGRNGDTMLAHITPAEARMLMRMGGSGTINPYTGLPEFFIKKLVGAVTGAVKAVGSAITSVAKAVGGALKSVGEAVVNTVKSVATAVKDFAKSKVGQIVTSVALGFFLGPAAASMLGVTSAAGVAAISGFVGGAGSSILAGNSVKDALKNGAIGAVTAGAVTGLTGGAAAFKTGSYTGPTTVSESWKQFTEGVTGKSGAAAGAADEAAAAADDTAALRADQVNAARPGAGAPTAAQSVPNYKINPETGLMEFDGTFTVSQTDALGRTVSQTTTGTPTFGGVTPTAAAQNLDDLKLDVIGGRTGAVPTPAIERIAAGPTPGITTPTAGPNYLTGNLDEFAGGVRPAIPDPARNYLIESPALSGGPNLTPVTTPAGSAAAGGAAAPSQGVMSLLGEGKIVEAGKEVGRQAAGLYDEYLSPSGITARGNIAAQQASDDVYASTLARTGSDRLAAQAADRAFNAAAPGMLATYGPLAATGLGAAYLGGAFDVEQPPKPDIPTSGTELYKRDPYLLEPDISTVSASTGQPYQYGGFDPNVSTFAASTGQAYDFNARPYTTPVYAPPSQPSTYAPYQALPMNAYRPIRAEEYRPLYAAKGGIASLPKDPQNFPRKTGPINGPGTGTSDSIPAMLSDGEFVFTAKAVRAMGGGSRRKGAKRMYALMKALEKRA